MRIAQIGRTYIKPPLRLTVKYMPFEQDLRLTRWGRKETGTGRFDRCNRHDTGDFHTECLSRVGPSLIRYSAIHRVPPGMALRVDGSSVSRGTAGEAWAPSGEAPEGEGAIVTEVVVAAYSTGL